MNVDSYGQSPILFLDVVKILKKRNVSYAIIGAFAASFYGVIRASVDIDAIISIENVASSMNRFIEDLEAPGYHITFRMGDQDDPIGAVINIEDAYTNRVDLLMNIKAMDEDLFKRSVEAAFMGHKINIVGLEDFIAMKIFAGSLKDLNDVKGVLEVLNSKYDKKLLKGLLLRQGTESIKTLNKLLNKGK